MGLMPLTLQFGWPLLFGMGIPIATLPFSRRVGGPYYSKAYSCSIVAGPTIQLSHGAESEVDAVEYMVALLQFPYGGGWKN
jgi:hypothetical protein